MQGAQSFRNEVRLRRTAMTKDEVQSAGGGQMVRRRRICEAVSRKIETI